MQADKDHIKRSLELLFQRGDTIELRCVGNRTINGFYRDLDKLADDAFRLNSSFDPLENCYVCLNPVQPELHGRRADQFSRCAKGESVSDRDVLHRRWLLIDCDAIRPKDVSATNPQKQAAVEVANQVYTWLEEELGLKEAYTA